MRLTEPAVQDSTDVSVHASTRALKHAHTHAFLTPQALLHACHLALCVYVSAENERANEMKIREKAKCKQCHE